MGACPVGQLRFSETLSQKIKMEAHKVGHTLKASSWEMEADICH